MTLEGAINLNETENYIIYTMNSATTGQYGVVVPKNITGTLNMLVDLHMKSSFDGVGNGSKTKEQLVAEIGEEYDKVKVKYANGILVMPMIDEEMFKNTVATGDKQKMFDEVKKIGAITSELYKKLTESGIEKQKIDQKIIIIEKNQDDERFVAWLKEQMPNFVDGVLYSELSGAQEMVNPFVGGTSIFGPAPTVESKPEETPTSEIPANNGGGIFDTVAPVAPAASVEPVVPSVPVEEPVVQAPVENVAPAENNANVDIFGIPLDVKGVQNTETANNTVVQNELVSSNPVETAAVVDVPKPVESATLEGTTTFNPIQTPVANVNNNDVETTVGEEGNATKNSSKGFANLIILLVVLVGVTIASIELGKFLYSVYGA